MTERSEQNDWVPLFEQPITDVTRKVFDVFRSARKRGIHLTSSADTLSEELGTKVNTAKKEAEQLIEDGQKARVKTFISVLIDNKLEKIASGNNY